MILRLALYALVSIVLLSALLALRLVQVLHRTHSTAPRPKRAVKPTATLAVFLGSGGHTAEMMRLISSLDWTRYTSRIYLISSGDTLSERKALALESSIGSGSHTFIRIPRARAVHQSYFTSVFTTLHSLAFCVYHISLRPLASPSRRFADLVLLNGPGSCVPIAYSTLLSRLFALPSPALIYVESLARTKRLSVSGVLVRPAVDRFFVQWEGLRDRLREKEGLGSRLRAKVEWEGWLV